MAATRNLSIRLGIDGAAEAKAALESLSGSGSAALDRIRGSLEKLSTGDLGGKFADQLGAAAAKVAAAQKQLATAPAGDAAATLAAQKQLTAALDGYNATLERRRAQLVPTAAAEQALAKAIGDVAAAEKLGAISAAEATGARQRAEATYQRQIASLGGVEKAHGAAAAATRNLTIQGVQFFSSIQGGIPITTAFIQQGHQVVDSALAMGTGFKGIIEAAKGIFSAVGGLPTLLGVGVVGALGAAGAAAEHEATRLGNLRQQLRSVHDDYASLAVAVDNAAKQAAATSTLSTSQAQQAAQTIASAKYFKGTQDDLLGLTKVSADLARVWGGDLVASSKEVALAFDDPAKAAKDLAERGFPGMTAAIAETIGKMAAAGEAGRATNTVLGILRTGTAGAAQDASPLSKALHDLEQRLYGARDGGKSLATQAGELVDSFAALQVRGLDRLIEGLDKFIQKTATAAAANKQLMQQAPPRSAEAELGLPGVGDVSQVNPNTVAPAVTGALAQVDQSIRAMVQAAATQNRVDTEILARLQHYENAAPRADGTWAPSGTGPVGPMQVAPSTFANLPGFSGQNVNDPQTNINAGTALFAHLLQKYGNPYMAVLAYHDGETLIDHMLRGDWNPATNSTYQASTAGRMEAEHVTGGYSGTGLLGSSGAAASSKPVVNLPAQPTYYDPISSLVAPGGISVNEPRAILDQAQAAAKGLDQVAQSREALIAQQKLFEAALKIPGQTPEQIDLWNRSIRAVTGSLNDAQKPAQLYVRSLQDQLPAAQAAYEGDQKLAEVQQRLAEMERSQPGSVTPAVRAQAIAAAVDLQDAAYRKVVVGVEDNIAAQGRLTQAYGAGYGAVAQTTAYTAALVTAYQLYPHDAEKARAAVISLTAEYDRQAQSARETAVAQKNLQSQDDIKYVQAEIDTLGQSNNARELYLANLKAEQYLVSQRISQNSELGQSYLSNVEKLTLNNQELRREQQALSDLTGAFSSIADTIGNDITQAFVQGSGAGVNFKTVLQGLETQVVSLVAKLALINPILNAIDGGTRTTFSSAIDAIGKLFGGSTTSVASSVAGTGVTALEGIFGGAGITAPALASGASGIVGGGFDIGSIATSAGGIGSTGLGLVERLGNFIATSTESILSTSQTSIDIAKNVAGLADGATGTAFAERIGAAVGEALGQSEAGVASFASAAGQVADALPYIGTAISVITDLASGNYRGAGLVAGGAALGAGVGAIFAPETLGLSVAIGAALGGLADALFPAHPLHSYQGTEVTVADGQLSLGRSVSQVQSAADTRSALQDYEQQLNAYMAAVGIHALNPSGVLGSVGQGIQGYTQVTDVGQLFNKLRFIGNADDNSNFGIVKQGALPGMTFQSPQELSATLLHFASFADALSATGIKLSNIGTNLANIQIESVGHGPSNTYTVSSVTNAQGQNVLYQSDLHTALNADLPGKSFADTAALDAEIDKVNTFVNQTVPQLLTPIEATTSAVMDSVNKIFKQYDDAIAQSLQYGLDNTAQLQAAKEQAVAIVRRQSQEQIDQTGVSLAWRYNVATGGSASMRTGQQLAAFDANAQQEREARQKQFTDTFGDSILNTQGFADAMADFNKTIAAERQQTVDSLNTALQAQQQGIHDAVAGFQARDLTASGQGRAAELLTYDTRAAQERQAFIDQYVAFGGEAIKQTKDYQDAILELDRTQAQERLAIQNKYYNEAGKAITSLIDYARGLQTSDASPLSPKAQYDLASSQFNAVYGAASAGDYNSIQHLQGYADTFLSTSRALYGSGVNYAADFTKILDALGAVGSLSEDQLTASYMATLQQDSTDQLKEKFDELKAEIVALRREVQNQTRAMAT